MPNFDFLNFDILIERDSDGSYRRTVENSPAGVSARSSRFTFDERELQYLQGVISRSYDRSELEHFGAQLFDTLYQGDTLTLFRRSQDHTRRQNQGLRLRLRLDDAPELASLAWEYLYDVEMKHFLALSGQFSIVRYSAIARTTAPVSIEPPLRILAVFASPHDLAPTDLEKEWQGLQQACADLTKRGLVELTRLERATLRELQRALHTQPVHILHFSGYGAFSETDDQGFLVLEDENGSAQRVNGDPLGIVLANQSSLRLTVLNAGEGGRTSLKNPTSGIAQRLVRQGLPAVVAMQSEITDSAAVTFADEFYRALVDNYPVDAAMTEARKAMYVAKTGSDWGSPVLFTSTADNVLFNLSSMRAAQTEDFTPGSGPGFAETAEPSPSYAPYGTTLPQPESPDPGHIYALLIGIDHYADPALQVYRGCVNDVDAMRSFLTERLKVSASNILLLTNAEATRANILSAWKEHLGQARTGDQVFFHFSGNGTQSANTDPYETGTRTQTLLTYDSRSDDRAHDLLDRELAKLAEEIEKQGAGLSIFLDTCHAGDGFHGGNADANYVLLASCRENELSYEMRDPQSGRWHGAASYFLLQALANINPSTTWADLYDFIYANVKMNYHKQTPQLIGPGSRRLFGEEEPLPPYLLVTHVEEGVSQRSAMQKSAMAFNSKRIQINGGAAVGISEGSELWIYPPRHNTRGTPNLTAEVVEVMAESAWAEVRGPDDVPLASRVRVAAPGNWGEVNQVAISTSIPATVETRYVNSVESVDEDTDWQVEFDGAQVTILAADGAPTGIRLPLSPDGLVELNRPLEHLARYRNCLRFQNGFPDAQLNGAVEIEAATFEILSRDGRPIGGEPLTDGAEVGIGEKIVFTIRNRSEIDLFVALVYLSPEYGVHKIYPNRTDCQLLIGGGVVRVPVEITLLDPEREGDGIYKLFACTQSTAFDAILLPDLLEVAHGAR